MSLGLDKLDWQTVHGPIPQETSRLREPARAVAVFGAVMTILGCLLPWATGIDGLGRRVAFGANDGTADGVLIAVAAVFVLVVSIDRGAAETRSRTLQLAPFLTVSLAALIWTGGLRTSGFAIDAWVDAGGRGSHAAGVWLTIIGIALGAIGSGWVYLRRSAEIRAETKGLLEEWTITWRGLAEAAAGIIGAVIGGGLALAVTVEIAGSLGVLLMIILSTIGFVFGMRLAIDMVDDFFKRIGAAKRLDGIEFIGLTDPQVTIEPTEAIDESITLTRVTRTHRR